MSNTGIFSPDAETGILTLVIKNPDLVTKMDGLKFYMLSSTANQIIMSEIEDLNSKDLHPDAHMLLSSLTASGQLEKCGGKSYLEFLLTQEFPIENFQEFVKIVVASYKARSLLSITSKVRADSMNLSNIDEQIRGVRDSIENLSNSVSVSDVQHVGDGVNKAFDEIVSRTKNPGIRGVPWNIKKIDLVTGGKNAGDVWVLGGRPGSGKTAMICNAVVNDGAAGIPSLTISKEMNYQTLLERYVAIDSGVGISNIRLGLLNQGQLDAVRESLTKIRKYPIYMDTNFSTDPYYLENIIKKYVLQHGVKTIYVDYIQLLAERDDGMTHALGKLTRMFKLNANALDVSVVVLSQLNRDVEHRDNKRPQLSDLRQSGNIEEDADLVVGLYRDEYYHKDTKYPGTMEFNILKNRNGPVGTITLDFIAETNKISST